MTFTRFGNEKVQGGVLAALRVAGRALSPKQLVGAVKKHGVRTDEVFVAVALDDLRRAGVVTEAAGGGKFEAVPQSVMGDTRPCLYVVDVKSGEAQGGVHFFCSEFCRHLADRDELEPQSAPGALRLDEGVTPDWPEGTVCETCCVELGREGTAALEEAA